MNHRPSTAQLRCSLTVCRSLPDKNVSVFVEQDPLLETPVLVWNPPPPWLHAGPGFSPAEQLVGGIAPVTSPQITWHMFPGSSIRHDVRGIYHLVFVPRCSSFSSVCKTHSTDTWPQSLSLTLWGAAKAKAGTVCVWGWRHQSLTASYEYLIHHLEPRFLQMEWRGIAQKNPQESCLDMNNVEISKKKPFCLLKKMCMPASTPSVLLILSLTTSAHPVTVQPSSPYKSQHPKWQFRSLNTVHFIKVV